MNPSKLYTNCTHGLMEESLGLLEGCEGLERKREFINIGQIYPKKVTINSGLNRIAYQALAL